MRRALFDGPAPRVRTIPAGAPFLDVLVDALVEALDPSRDPLALADALVFVPNRRAGRALLDAFAARAPFVTLPPTIRPLGDIDDDPDVWGPGGLELDLPPAIAPLRRRLELATLVQARDEAMRGFADPVRALAMADALGGLLDSAAVAEGVDWSGLTTLVEEADFAEHWRGSLQFLSIVSEAWPARLAEDGLLDPGARRALLLRRLAETWEAAPPERPIVIAGSTGSIAAARALMATTSRLPRGCVVLPGLDQDFDAGFSGRLSAGHPQSALRATARALMVAPADVAALGDDGQDAARARRDVLREALAPAEATADWLARLEAAGGGDWLRRGLAGMKLVEAATPDEEARVCALLLREALETPGRTAALVTPDRALAARVAAKLARWGVMAAPTAGRPLWETSSGALLAALLALCLDEAVPAPLAALIRHPLCGAPEDARRALEQGGRNTIGLRGPRRFSDLDDLQAKAAPPAQELVARIAEALAPIRAAFAAPVGLDEAATALGAAAETICGGAIWDADGGPSAAAALESIRDHAGGLAVLAPDQAVRALERLLGEAEAAPTGPAHPRLAIWGPLEARLQRRDLMILGGLNEGTWPAPPSLDPFLTRSMRAKLGLPDPEALLGLAAHDFAHAAANPDVVLTRSKRTGDAPSVASRWIWRLTTLATGAGARDALDFPAAADPLRWARALDRPARRIEIAEPKPTPPPADRPRTFAVTRVETLIRDPYAVYAREVLGLRALDPVGAPFGPAPRGVALHAALEAFTRAGGTDGEALLALIEGELAAWGQPPERRRQERARLRRAAFAYAAWCAERAGPGWRSLCEVEALHDHPAGFSLRAKADRIDLGPDGVEIIDYKTGAPPTQTQIEAGLAPQLPLEAALLSAGAFSGVSAAPARALTHWRFGGASPGPLPIAGDPEALGLTTLENLAALLARYGDPAQPYLSKPRAKFANERADYDLLARRKEWANAEAEE